MNTKVFEGDPQSRKVKVTLITDGKALATYPLEHHVRHSPDGFSWGYHGSGPAELAKDLLTEHMGVEPSVLVYQAFKRNVIAELQQNEPFVLTGEFIDEALEIIHSQHIQPIVRRYSASLL